MDVDKWDRKFVGVREEPAEDLGGWRRMTGYGHPGGKSCKINGFLCFMSGVKLREGAKYNNPL